jgi:hypothetical protein
MVPLQIETVTSESEVDGKNSEAEEKVKEAKHAERAHPRQEKRMDR